MSVLNKQHIEESYFRATRDYSKVITEVSEYNGEDRINIGCTQLHDESIHMIMTGLKGYSNRDKKRILDEWIDFLRSNTKELKAIHFCSHVPQRLFDAACCQKNLEELYCKWGTYKNLSALENLKELKYLSIRGAAGFLDISTLGKLKTLIVLCVENFKSVEDYSFLATLDKLEQLVISGPILGTVPIKDLDFLLDMKSLLSFWRPNTTLRKKYTDDELAALRSALPNLTFCYNSGL